MLSESITKMDFVFVNTAAEKKVSNSETEDVRRDFKSYLKDTNQETTETQNKSDKNQAVEDSKTDESVEVNKKDEYLKIKTDSKVDSGEQDLNEIDENQIMYEMVLESVNDIIEIIQSVFNITDDEIETALNQLNISEVEILNVNNLNNLLTKLSPNGELANLLVDDKMTTAIKEIYTVVENLENTLKTEFGLTDNQINDLYESIKEFSMYSEEVEVEAEPMREIQPKQNQQNIENTNTLSTNENTYQTGKTESSETQNNTGNNNEKPTDEFSQGVMNKITEILENNQNDDVDAVKIIKQIVDEIKLSVKQDMTKLEMQLYPEHLGKLSLEIMSKEGAVTAQITAQTIAAKEAIESQLVVLKQNMEEQGIKIESIEVTLASHGFEQNNEGNNEDISQKSSKKTGLLKKADLEEEIDSETEEIVRNEGSTVSYTA